jgi:hypothetical protein
LMGLFSHPRSKTIQDASTFHNSRWCDGGLHHPSLTTGLCTRSFYSSRTSSAVLASVKFVVFCDYEHRFMRLLVRQIKITEVAVDGRWLGWFSLMMVTEWSSLFVVIRFSHRLRWARASNTSCQRASNDWNVYPNLLSIHHCVRFRWVCPTDLQYVNNNPTIADLDSKQQLTMTTDEKVGEMRAKDQSPEWLSRSLWGEFWLVDLLFFDVPTIRISSTFCNHGDGVQQLKERGRAGQNSRGYHEERGLLGKGLGCTNHATNPFFLMDPFDTTTHEDTTTCRSFN